MLEMYASVISICIASKIVENLYGNCVEILYSRFYWTVRPNDQRMVESLTVSYNISFYDDWYPLYKDTNK